MSIKVYRVSEKTAINFLALLQYAEVIDRTIHNQIVENHQIKSKHIGIGSHGVYLQFAEEVMDYNIRKFTSMDFEFPGAVCRGRMLNPTRKECSICYEDVLENTFVARMDCKHIFHEPCLLRWLKSGRAMANYCPLCRCEIDSGHIVTVSIYDKCAYEWKDKQ